MQLTTLHSEIRSMQTLVDETKGKQERLLDERLPAFTMIQMQKKLKEESQLSNKITKVEERMSAMDRTLHELVEGNIHTNKLFQQLLNTPHDDQTLDANKKGEKEAGSVVHEPTPIEAQDATAPAQSIQIAPTSNERAKSSVAFTETRGKKIKTLA